MGLGWLDGWWAPGWIMYICSFAVVLLSICVGLPCAARPALPTTPTPPPPSQAFKEPASAEDLPPVVNDLDGSSSWGNWDFHPSETNAKEVRGEWWSGWVLWVGGVGGWSGWCL